MLKIMPTATPRLDASHGSVIGSKIRCHKVVRKRCIVYHERKSCFRFVHTGSPCGFDVTDNHVDINS